MIQPPERIVISFVRFSSSLPFLPSRHSLPLLPFSLSLFAIVAPARRSNTPLPCYGTPTHPPGPFLLLRKSVSLSLLFRASSPSLASWRHLWLNRLRGVGIRPAWIVAHVGVLVCEFRGIVSVEHFPAWIGTRGIGSLGARMDRDPLCSRLSPRRALSARVVSLRRPWLFRLWATRKIFSSTRLRPRDIFAIPRVCVALNYARSSLPIVSLILEKN